MAATVSDPDKNDKDRDAETLSLSKVSKHALLSHCRPRSNISKFRDPLHLLLDYVADVRVQVTPGL
jgi:hypothetical protein